ncbi:DUF4129 domain-containing protein [Kitasatospora sp. NPDC048365]|uniref:DUF4129 domain-containing protein n=1 Tax=Kitasatospora sp. NPDC048365 TaxID=3364050 RepID=UPI003723D930
MPYWGEGAPLGGGAPVTVPRDPAREAAERELLNPAYHHNDPGVIDRLMDWISDRVDEVFDSVGTPFDTGATAAVVGILLLLALVAVLWWRLGAPARRARSQDTLFASEGPRSAAQHRAAAADHAAAGEWADAVREQMRALVRGLEERALLDPRPGRTADEAAGEAGRTLPEHAAALTDAARVFDDIAFGERTADQNAYRALADLDRALQATRPTLTPVGGGPA